MKFTVKIDAESLREFNAIVGKIERRLRTARARRFLRKHKVGIRRVNR